MSIQKTQDPIRIKKERTLAQVLKDASHYMGGDALLLCKAAGLYSLSLLFFSLLLTYVAVDTYPSPENLYYLKGIIPPSHYALLAICVIVFTGSFCTLTLVINKLLLLREERTDDTSNQLFSSLQSEFSAQLKNYAINFLIIYILYYLIDLCLSSPFLIQLSPEEASVNLLFFYVDLNRILGSVLQLLLMPLVLYFGFSSLFMSVRDSIGSSDALKKIYVLSKPRIQKIWLCSFVLLLAVWLGKWVLNYRSGFLINLLPFNFNLLFVAFTLKKIVSFSLLAFVQVATVLLFGSVEAEAERPVEDELEEPSNA